MAWAAVASAGGVVLAVCEDSKAAADVALWVRNAVPNLTEASVVEVPSERMLDQLEQSPAPIKHTVFVAPDATEGNAADVEQRWRHWNAARDRLLATLRGGTARAILLIATQTRMPEVVRAAPDLLAVAQVITVEDEPYAVSASDEELVAVYRQARDELERRYGLTTAEFLGRLRRREPTGIEPAETNRWQAIAQALRKVDP